MNTDYFDKSKSRISASQKNLCLSVVHLWIIVRLSLLKPPNYPSSRPRRDQGDSVILNVFGMIVIIQIQLNYRKNYCKLYQYKTKKSPALSNRT